MARRGRGFCLFQMPSHVTDPIVRTIIGAADCRVVSLRDLTLDSKLTKGAVITNLTWKDALAHGSLLYRFIARVNRERAPLWVLAPDTFDEWVLPTIWAPRWQEKLRSDTDSGEGDREFQYIDRDALCAYQFFQEIKRLGPVFASPQLLKFSEADPPLSYLEEEMARAMNRAGLHYKAGVKVGPFHVNFLVSFGDTKVVVECDGATHRAGEEAQGRRNERDEKIRQLGLSTLHFTGFEIARDATLCAASVSNFLSSTQDHHAAVIEIASDLDDSQKNAVSGEEGSQRLLAPAGAGKTKTLTNRIGHLVNEGLPPKLILAVAFNRKAREEMRERLDRMSMRQVEVRTFHGLGQSICRRDLGMRWTPKGTDMRMVRKAVGQKLFELLSERVKQMPRDIRRHSILMNAFDRAKDTLSHPYEYFVQAILELKAKSNREVKREDLPPVDDPVWQKVFEDALDYQVENACYTFADMIYIPVRRLSENPQALLRVQQRWVTILVDEFQDLNRAQMSLTDLLASGHNNLTVVGDDDQMIYSFRGANVDFIRDFNKLFPGSDSKTLSTNYRCFKRLVHHSNFLIARNTMRVPKQISPAKDKPEGVIDFYVGVTLDDEIDRVVRFIHEHCGEGKRPWKEIGIITRYKQNIEMLIEGLQAADIPVNVEIPPFYSTVVARTMLSYLHALIDWPNPPASVWGDVLKAPTKYIGYDFIDKVVGSPDAHGMLTEAAAKNKYILSLLTNLDKLSGETKGMPTTAMLEALDAVFKLTDHFKEEAEQGDDNDNTDGSVVIEGLKHRAQKFEDPRAFLHSCLSKAEEEKAEKSKEQTGLEPGAQPLPEKDAVSVMTIHASKGKEWPIVVLYHGEQRDHRRPKGISDARWKQERQKLDEEERRVHYVAVTRAEKKILLTAPAGNVVQYFSEYLKNPKFAEAYDIEKDLTAANIRLANDNKKHSALRARLKDAEQRADVEATQRKLAPHEEIVRSNSSAFEIRQGVLTRAKAHLDRMLNSGQWDCKEGIDYLVQTFRFPDDIRGRAADWGVRQQKLTTLNRKFSVGETLRQFVADPSSLTLKKLKDLEDSLAIELGQPYEELKRNGAMLQDLEKAVSRTREDIDEAQGHRRLFDKLKAAVGLAPARERRLKERLNSLGSELKQARRAHEDAVEVIRRETEPRLGEIEVEMSAVRGELAQAEKDIRVSIEAAIASLGTEVMRLNAILRQGRDSIVEIEGARAGAASEVVQLKKAVAHTKQAISSSKQLIDEMQFEKKIRGELTKPPFSRPITKAR